MVVALVLNRIGYDVIREGLIIISSNVWDGKHLIREKQWSESYVMHLSNKDRLELQAYSMKRNEFFLVFLGFV